MGLNDVRDATEDRRRVPAAPTTIRIDIAELVFDGFDLAPRDVDRVRQAFHGELDRLVRERGVPAALLADGDRALDLLSGLPELPATGNPRRLGEALARAVHAGLSGAGAGAANSRMERG
ncbi:hypothetical protein [Streptomyces camelliae]|uniref:Uncharacterized protein n=1 Tax=Streptomyces camelliae TaxID=3004093 RepID=A0ABY7PE91_9ACTN|nr:hypothetical protein [Streptomyces sp. HUAS 2-6]WBO67902.1 hypothetical protein O1G22_36330 [Streptomyces sp. HUAS 2-6]